MCYLASNGAHDEGMTNEEIWYNNNKHPYNKSKNDAKSPRLCYGCGEQGHWISVCPYLGNSPYHPNYSNYGHYPNNQHGHYPNNQQYRPPYQQQQSGPHRTHFATEENQPDDKPARSMYYGIGQVSQNIPDEDETLNHAVLDTGASETVCGDRWFNMYVNSLENEQLTQIHEESCNIMLNYGNGVMRASRKVTLPMIMTNQTVMLEEVLVVDADVPLLISLKAMKRLKMKIDCTKNEISIGSDIQISAKSTESGKYLIPLSVNKPLQPPNCPINYTECIQRTYLGKPLF